MMKSDEDARSSTVSSSSSSAQDAMMFQDFRSNIRVVRASLLLLAASEVVRHYCYGRPSQLDFAAVLGFFLVVITAAALGACVLVLRRKQSGPHRATDFERLFLYCFEMTFFVNTCFALAVGLLLSLDLILLLAGGALIVAAAAAPSAAAAWAAADTYGSEKLALALRITGLPRREISLRWLAAEACAGFAVVASARLALLQLCYRSRLLKLSEYFLSFLIEASDVLVSFAITFLWCLWLSSAVLLAAAAAVFVLREAERVARWADETLDAVDKEEEEEGEDLEEEEDLLYPAGEFKTFFYKAFLEDIVFSPRVLRGSVILLAASELVLQSSPSHLEMVAVEQLAGEYFGDPGSLRISASPRLLLSRLLLVAGSSAFCLVMLFVPASNVLASANTYGSQGAKKILKLLGFKHPFTTSANGLLAAASSRLLAITAISKALGHHWHSLLQLPDFAPQDVFSVIVAAELMRTVMCLLIFCSASLCLWSAVLFFLGETEALEVWAVEVRRRVERERLKRTTKEALRELSERLQLEFGARAEEARRDAIEDDVWVSWTSYPEDDNAEDNEEEEEETDAKEAEEVEDNKERTEEEETVKEEEEEDSDDDSFVVILKEKTD